jgi:hypothetical protein
MNLIEFIGFLITMSAMTFLILRRIWEERQKRSHPEEYDKKKEHQEANLKQFLKSLDIDMNDDEEPEKKPFLSVPKPFDRQQKMTKRMVEPPPHKYIVPSHIYTVPKVQNLAEGYHAIVKVKQSRASRMIDRLPSRKEMIVYQEIMNPPVSMR